jgi:hypothetical protein
VKSSLDEAEYFNTTAKPCGDTSVAIWQSPRRRVEFGRAHRLNAGYNEHGTFFSSPVRENVFSGILFNDGHNNVIISEGEAKQKIQISCKTKIAPLSATKRAQVGGRCPR